MSQYTLKYTEMRPPVSRWGEEVHRGYDPHKMSHSFASADDAEAIGTALKFIRERDAKKVSGQCDRDFLLLEERPIEGFIDALTAPTYD
jgi:hypothetical protein